MSESSDAAAPKSGRPDSRSQETDSPPVEEPFLPRHVAFIMDGNGRWAERRGLRRLRGHEKGAETLRLITRRSRALGVPEVTFYALSTENLDRRPDREVKFLLRLLKKYLVGERRELLDNDIRLRTIGNVEAFPPDVLRELRETERLTSHCKSMVMRLALNYGSRQEILSAVKGVMRDVHSGLLRPEDVEGLDEQRFARYLYDSDMTDPDLMIRTAGEYRLSNFLLWQLSYAEIWVTDLPWPEFDKAAYDAALASFASRVRRYGAVVSAQPRRRGRRQPEPVSGGFPEATESSRNA